MKVSTLALVSGDAKRYHSAGTRVPGVAAGKDGRAVECTGLENQRAGNGTVGSNPTPSAKYEY